MKYFLRLIILLLLPFTARSQEPPLNIIQEMFSNDIDAFNLGAADGWHYKQGNKVNGAQENINISTWTKLKPTELTIKNADKYGKVEGWFRIKINLDSNLGNKSFGIKMGSWAAADLYINGELVNQTGNTGNNGNPFKGYNAYGKLSYQANLKKGEAYTISIHTVEYTAHLLPSALRSTASSKLQDFIMVTGPQYDETYINLVQQNSLVFAMPVAVCVVLSLLFWILFFQNKKESNLQIIAFGTTCMAITFFTNFIIPFSSSYTSFEVWRVFNVLFGGLSFMLILLIIVTIFKRKISFLFKVVLALYLPLFCISIFVPEDWSDMIELVLVAVLFIICIYYVASSWKTLKGAQWAVVAGILTFLSLIIVLYIFRNFVGSSGYFIVSFPLTIGLALSFPLSLLVYVAMRFKEVVTDLKENSEQVLQLSEEKKEQAEKQKEILQEEVAKQTAEIRTTLSDLKATQSQLIQSEKMASLGELTAGIAHEIQNPLNFVNNFSEVSRELIEELKSEKEKLKKEEQDELLNDIDANLQKINHHGKRADAIVKGMLQHSQSSTGKKEPTDINALADEYLRLAYHGLRAKDKSFNADFKTDFDESLEKVNIIPQDIGRVILNLITNAFYAVNEKKQQSKEDYEPIVTVSSKKIGDSIQVSVADNGNGIPQKVLDKIFQPFFTTKPTGQGTGLGLSLAFDIVTKGHGGELKVETKVADPGSYGKGEGSTFIIQIPN